MNLFDHLGVVVTDLASARAFYSACLDTIGVQLLQDNSETKHEGWLVYGANGINGFFVVSAGQPSFWKEQSEAGRSPIHLAFAAPSKKSVDDFHRVGLASGGVDNGAPGMRPSSTSYYAAYLLDPDGNNIETGFRTAI